MKTKFDSNCFCIKIFFLLQFYIKIFVSVFKYFFLFLYCSFFVSVRIQIFVTVYSNIFFFCTVVFRSVRYYKNCYSFFVSVIHLLQFFVSVRYYKKKKNCSSFFRFCIIFVTVSVLQVFALPILFVNMLCFYPSENGFAFDSG